MDDPLMPTIYVVDDDTDVLVSLRFLLETEGFDVKTFANGPALLAASPPGPGDCLVVDYRMAGMNGLELVLRLRDRAVSTPVVLVTVDEGAAARAAGCGVRHVVMKPHIDESLVTHIQTAVRENGGG